MRAGQAHNNHIYLVGNLPHRAGKLLGHIQEWHHNADAEGHAGNADIGYVAQHQRAAHQRYYHIHHVTDITQQRHQNVGEAVTVAGVKEDLAIDLVKVSFGALLMAEYLDDLLSGHHFLHKGLGLS